MIQVGQILIIVLISLYIGLKLGKRGILIDKEIRNEFETRNSKKKYLKKKLITRNSQIYYIQGILILLIIIYTFTAGFFLWQQAYFMFIIGLFKLNGYVSTIFLFTPLLAILVIKYLLVRSVKNYTNHISKDDQYMQQQCDSIISKLGSNLVKFMKNTLLKHENEEFLRQKEILMKQNIQKSQEKVENVTQQYVVQTCGKECKQEKAISEKNILKYSNFVDQITSFAWCEVCSNSQQIQEESDILDQKSVCIEKCIEKYMNTCKTIGEQYNKDDEQISIMQNQYNQQTNHKRNNTLN